MISIGLRTSLRPAFPAHLRRPALLARIALVVGVGLLSWFGGFDGLQTTIGDLRFSVLTRPVTGKLLFVDIDEPSIKALGAWPWSRAVHAAILDKLTALGAADVAFDVDFSSPSPGPGDRDLEGALQRAGGSTILAALQQEVASPSDGRVLFESRPLPRFAAQAWEAAVNVQPDSDGRVRNMARGERFGTTTMPLLATLLASQSGRLDGTYAIDFGIDDRQLDRVSVRDLLQGAVDPSRVRDRAIIVGASAVELRDIFQVPRFGFIPGPAVQSMAAESLMQGRALQPVGTGPTLIITLGLLGVLCWLTRHLTFSSSLGCCALVAIVAEACALAVQAKWPLNPITAPIHAGLFGFASLIVVEEGIARRLHLLQSRRSAGRLRAMLDRVIADSFAGVVIVDADGRIRAASTAATAILQTELRVASGPLFSDTLPPTLARLVDDALGRARTGHADPVTCETEVVPPGCAAVLLACVVTVSALDPAPHQAALAAESHVVCLTFQDITAERQAHDKLVEMARVDGLSGLANRSVLLEVVGERANQQETTCSGLMFLNVDRFKLVNDRLGHSTGDALIRAVADRLRSSIVPGDVAARLGGDEFAVVIERSTRQEVEIWATNLGRELGGHYDVGSYQPSVTVSIGVAFFEGRNATEMMTATDAALHAAKAAGGGCVRLYDAAIANNLADADRLAHDLRVALARGELQVVYQRQVDAISERVIGVEALVRWRHPERGMVSPARFIPIAERTGLIEPIGAFVLATACRDAVTWPEPIKVSVNLSAVQLARTDLADLILSTLRQTGLPAHRLDLELTESLLLDNDEVVATTLARLRAAGAKISLDDFGTGYSSLGYLNRFAIDKIKIDQSFVRGLATISSAAPIIRAVVGLARDIGLRVNVEGVETAEQLLLVQQLGCDEVQGFLHGRPEAASAIHASLLEQVGTEPARTAA